MNVANTGRDGEPYLFHFGAYGWTKVLAFGRSLEDALDSAVDWLAVHAPGLLADDSVADRYREAESEWRLAHPGKEPSERTIRAWQASAEVDTTLASDCHYLNSWEWCVSGPFDRQQLGEVIRDHRRASLR